MVISYVKHNTNAAELVLRSGGLEYKLNTQLHVNLIRLAGFMCALARRTALIPSINICPLRLLQSSSLPTTHGIGVTLSRQIDPQSPSDGRLFIRTSNGAPYHHLPLTGTKTMPGNSIWFSLLRWTHRVLNGILVIMSGWAPRIVFCLQSQWMGPAAQLFQGRIHLVGNRGARGEQTRRENRRFAL